MSNSREVGEHPALAARLADTLDPDVYDELHRIAVQRMAHEARAQTLQATALAHEAWLRIGAADGSGWQDWNHFYALASTTMRRILIDRARRKARIRYGGGCERVAFESIDKMAAPSTEDEALLLIDEGLAELEKAHPTWAQVVIAKFFGGLTNEEIAQQHGSGLRSVERQWALAKVWLLRWMERDLAR